MLIPFAILLTIAICVSIVTYLAITMGEMVPRREAYFMLLTLFGATLVSEAMCVGLLIWMRS